MKVSVGGRKLQELPVWASKGFDWRACVELNQLWPIQLTMMTTRKEDQNEAQAATREIIDHFLCIRETLLDDDDVHDDLGQINKFPLAH